MKNFIKTMVVMLLMVVAVNMSAMAQPSNNYCSGAVVYAPSVIATGSNASIMVQGVSNPAPNWRCGGSTPYTLFMSIGGAGGVVVGAGVLPYFNATKYHYVDDITNCADVGKTVVFWVVGGFDGTTVSDSSQITGDPCGGGGIE